MSVECISLTYLYRQHSNILTGFYMKAIQDKVTLCSYKQNVRIKLTNMMYVAKLLVITMQVNPFKVE